VTGGVSVFKLIVGQDNFIVGVGYLNNMYSFLADLIRVVSEYDLGKESNR
jgi:hypothetical protein